MVISAPLYQTTNSSLQNQILEIVLSALPEAYIGIRKGNKEKSKTKISCKNCCPRLGRLVAWLAQWKKSALFARDSSPRAPPPYCSPCTNEQAAEGTIVIEWDCRANGNNRSCCHHDVLSPACLLACVPLAYSFSSSSFLCLVFSFVLQIFVI